MKSSLAVALQYASKRTESEYAHLYKFLCPYSDQQAGILMDITLRGVEGICKDPALDLQRAGFHTVGERRKEVECDERVTTEYLLLLM